jgi:predicted phosphodiesterase
VRLHVLSDLHLERGGGAPPVLDADAVVLAGDISTGTRGVEWARRWARTCPVIYVAGNHEFYGHSLPGLIGELRRAAADSSVHVLENDELILGGVRFLGCTLWSDFAFDGPDNRTRSMRVCERAVSDYHVIRRDDEPRPITAEETLARHRASRRWLTDRLAHGHDGPTVVVTHHAPYVVWRPPEELHRLLAGAFVSDLSNLMGGERAAMWIYGHTHRQADRRVAGTHLLSNPCGYPNEPVAGFDPGLVVAVGPDAGLSGPSPERSSRPRRGRYRSRRSASA